MGRVVSTPQFYLILRESMVLFVYDVGQVGSGRVGSD